MTTIVGKGTKQGSPDPELRKALGFWHLTTIALGGIIGSGWLLAPLLAARAAGPGSLITWLVGGIVLVPMALVLVELGASYPKSGGLARWPLLGSGRLVGTLAGWGIWIAYTANPPSEAAAALQYLTRYLPWLYGTHGLTPRGKLVAVGLMVLFLSVNWFGVQLFARFNTLLTIGKLVVPLIIVVVLLFGAHFDAHNLTGGSFMPYGGTSALAAITTAGVFFAYTGFQSPLDFTGETKGDRRNIPYAVVTALMVAMVLYTALQLAVLGAVKVPGHDWAALNHSTTYVQLVDGLGLGWLGIVLTVDAVASPGGAALVYTAEGSRIVYAMGHKDYRLMPRLIGAVHRASGQPRMALVVNFVIGVALLFLLKDWQNIITFASALALFGYAMSLISERAIRETGAKMANLVPWTKTLGLVSFVMTTLIFYWIGWARLCWVFGLLAVVALLGYGVLERFTDRFDRHDVLAGAWVIGYLAALAVVSALGDTQGAWKYLPKPYDSILAALIGVLGYASGLHGARRHLRRHPHQPQLDDSFHQ